MTQSRRIFSLILVSLAVFLGFRYFICDEEAIYCNATFDWSTMILAALAILVTIIGAAACLVIIFRLIRGTRKQSSFLADTELGSGADTSTSKGTGPTETKQ